MKITTHADDLPNATVNSAVSWWDYLADPTTNATAALPRADPRINRM